MPIKMLTQWHRGIMTHRYLVRVRGFAVVEQQAPFQVVQVHHQRVNDNNWIWHLRLERRFDPIRKNE